jgi:hypothetical protein
MHPGSEPADNDQPSDESKRSTSPTDSRSGADFSIEASGDLVPPMPIGAGVKQPDQEYDPKVPENWPEIDGYLIRTLCVGSSRRSPQRLATRTFMWCR